MKESVSKPAMGNYQRSFWGILCRIVLDRKSAAGVFVLPLLLLCCPLSAVSQQMVSANQQSPQINEFENFITDANVYLDERYRFEYVDQEAVARNAKASTLRSRLGLTTGTAYQLSGRLEFEDVSVVGNDSYNSTVNGKTEYPVVADPKTTVVNQAYISYQGIRGTSFSDTTLRVGREALQLDNQRFIGDVGWRQNNQTYDGAHIANESLTDTKIWYGYVGRVNRIFGEDSEVGDYDTDLHLLNVRYAGIKPLAITVYSYLYDISDDPTLSTANFGGRLQGTSNLREAIKLSYDGEYAYQQDYQNNPLQLSTRYWRSELQLAFANVSLIGGYESLGSENGAIGFSTPFATLHKWNGWADKFLTTPADGLQDAYVGIGFATTTLHPWIKKLAAGSTYHYFSAEHGNQKYGEEIDLEVTIDFLRYLHLGCKYALYDAAGFATDTEKLIFTIQVALAS